MAERKMFRVTSHRFRFGTKQPGERWFSSYDAALADVKERLGQDWLHKDARGSGSNLPDLEIEHDGATWKRTSSYKYSEMPQSSGKQSEFGYVLVEELRRPSQPFVSPFGKID